jgi:hypothetical protein
LSFGFFFVRLRRADEDQAYEGCEDDEQHEGDLRLIPWHEEEHAYHAYEGKRDKKVGFMPSIICHDRLDHAKNEPVKIKFQSKWKS